MEKQFPTGEAVFSHDFVVTPESCDECAGLSPLGVFTMLQSIATQHAELLGVGGAAMAKRGAFWLTVHNRVDFYAVSYTHLDVYKRQPQSRRAGWGCPASGP